MIFVSDKRYSVGRVFEMTMEIKPRTVNGVLVSVHGRRDFVLLQLKNGSLELSVDNGRGIFTTTYTPSFQMSFCDGKWHSVGRECILICTLGYVYIISCFLVHQNNVRVTAYFLVSKVDQYKHTHYLCKRRKPS